MAYDGALQVVVLFGGAGGPPSGHLNDTWAWNGQGWTQLQLATAPPPRVDASMAYDAARGRLVLFGGVGNTGEALGDTWTWDGHSWTQQHPPLSPPARGSASMAYDAARQQVVLFGGENTEQRTPTLLNDVWTWDGHTWTQQRPAKSPVARSQAAMAYDATRQVVVLFGGTTGSPLDDTWTWDGRTWTQQHPATSPSGRYRASMAYDEGSQQVVLFGGEAIAQGLNDTWTWDGTTWMQQQPATAPTAEVGYSASLAYDAARHLLLLFATSGGKQKRFSETWAWTGTTWRRLG